MPLRLALAQVNPTVGDLAGNAAKIVGFARRARAEGADLVLFPEMALTGYPPEDLLLDPLFLRRSADALRGLARDLPRDLVTVAGAPLGRAGRLYNGAAVFHGGRRRAAFHKWFLPNYGVFDEERYFLPGDHPVVLAVGENAVGLSVCEDVWRPGGPAPAAARRGARLILNLSASPFHAGKIRERVVVLRRKVRECGAALAYCNLVGGQDELVYDGGSLVMDARGRVTARAPQFEEALLVTDVALPRAAGTAAFSCPRRAETRPPLHPTPAPVLSPSEETYTALTTGIRDYVGKNGFSKVVIGLSGGVDSSLAACLAVDALGAGNVVGVTLPSRFNTGATRADARRLARNLGIAFHTVPIEPVVRAHRQALAPLFAGRAADVTEENLQSRVRGTLLMALSNKFGWLVLTTGNKSEVSTGYFTLYGDSVGGFAPLKDLPKTRVYELSRWRNRRDGPPPIPPGVLTRPPTAELRANQTDQDTLPPYPVLDRILRLHVEENRGADRIAGPRSLVRRVVKMIDGAEYKRRQSPPGVKITPRAFGRDRRMPLTNGFAG